MKWKYQKPKQRYYSYDTFARFKEGKPTDVKITDWRIEKLPVDGASRTVFTATITEMAGEKMDKFWRVYHYETVIALKKKLARKRGEIALKVKMYEDEDTLDNAYELL